MALIVCFSLVLGVSVNQTLSYIEGWVESNLRVINELLDVSGFPSREMYERFPLMDTDLGAIAGEFGLVNIREYIIKNMLPTWAQQQSDFGTYYFDCDVFVYPYYYIATISTNSAGLSIVDKNIYTGRMIRLDYEIRYIESGEMGFGTTRGLWSIYVFPKDDQLYYYSQYYNMKIGLLSDGYNSLNQFLGFDYSDLDNPFLVGPKARLTGHRFITPSNGAPSYELKNVTYSEVTFSQNADLFKKFMVGG